jgi:uncharacterized membrane protein
MKKFNNLILGLGALVGFMPNLAHAQTASTALGEVSSFQDLVTLLWNYGSQIILVMAVFFIVLGAFFYAASAGKQDRIEQGKELIGGSIAAIVLVLTSGILIELLHKPAQGTAGNLSEIPQVITNATNILTGAIGGFAILMMMYAAIQYTTAAGNPDKIEKAQRAFRYALLGLVIGVLAFGIVNAVVTFII